jgi:putative ABC transport system ATP-binding protein
MALIEELNAQGATIVVITHEQEIAARIPRQIRLRDGEIVADSTNAHERRDGHPQPRRSQRS